LAELAKKSEQIDSIGDIEDVIQDIDNRMSERIDERTTKDKDRVTRVLIGTVDGQELRFPLFKNRLTIGRTEQNDIQLNATYVSRRHAVIVTDHDATRVIDWGSKNGVMVNSNRITEHFLKNGDTVTIGTADFRYEERPKREI
jgi:pSer/pThr/pTyr-binding forkhead associated (FHA) protein